MLDHIRKLSGIAEAPARTIIGLMSGTSVDGLDIALCRFTGHGLSTKLTLTAFETVPYDDAFRTAIASVFAKRDADLETVCLLNGWIARAHGRMVLQALRTWGVSPGEVDLLASHGQTVYHAPFGQHRRIGFDNATLQLGDGDHLAVETGIVTVSDFRQKHIAAGGEGAPLAVYGDYFLFTDPTENRILLNMGGIANFTFLPAEGQLSEVFSSDTGPGNTMMDAYVRTHFPGMQFDKDAAIAHSGKVHEKLLASLKHHPFFALPFPKTSGPEVFNISMLDEAIRNSGTWALPHADIMATLNRYSADTISDSIRKITLGRKDFVLYASGGGVHNPLLMDTIRTNLDLEYIRSTQDLGVHPDAKEAVLFATLANETVAGDQYRFPETERRMTKYGGIPLVSLGKISFPG